MHNILSSKKDLRRHFEEESKVPLYKNNSSQRPYPNGGLEGRCNRNNGRLDLSFTKCNFPEDYLPYAGVGGGKNSSKSSSSVAAGANCDLINYRTTGYDNLAFGGGEGVLDLNGKGHHHPGMPTSSTSPFTYNSLERGRRPTLASGGSLQQGQSLFASNSLISAYHHQHHLQEQQNQQQPYHYHRSTLTLPSLPSHNLPSSSSTSSSSCLTTNSPNNHNYPLHPSSAHHHHLKFGSAHEDCCGRRYLKSCGCCLLVLFAVLLLVGLSLLVGFSLYLAVATNFLSTSSSSSFSFSPFFSSSSTSGGNGGSSLVYSISGSFKVVGGDDFTLRLLNQTSVEYVRKATRYEGMLAQILEKSLIGEILLHSEVVNFRKGSLLVFFRFYAPKSALDGLLDLHTKAVIGLGSIESVPIDEAVVLNRLRDIVRGAFRSQRPYLRRVHSDLTLDQEYVKVGHLEVITEAQYYALLSLRDVNHQQSAGNDADQHKENRAVVDTTTTVSSSPSRGEQSNVNNHKKDHHKWATGADFITGNSHQEPHQKLPSTKAVVTSTSTTTESSSTQKLSPALRITDSTTTTTTKSPPTKSATTTTTTTRKPTTTSTTTTSTTTKRPLPSTTTSTTTSTTSTTSKPSSTTSSTTKIPLTEFQLEAGTIRTPLHSAPNEFLIDDEFLLYSPTVDGGSGDVNSSGAKRIAKKLLKNSAPSKLNTVEEDEKDEEEEKEFDFEMKTTTASTKEVTPEVVTLKLNTSSSLQEDLINYINSGGFTQLPELNTESLTSTTTLPPTTTSSPCSNETQFRCRRSGECIPLSGHCDGKVIHCTDASDEADCRCADYLRSDPASMHKLCDGILDCEDRSDEHDELCTACPSPNSFLCRGHQSSCIEMSKVCNGEVDCMHGDDESGCIALVDPSTLATQIFEKKDIENGSDIGDHFNSEGILFIRHHGRWGPLCFDSFDENQVTLSQAGHHHQSSNEVLHQKKRRKRSQLAHHHLQVEDMGEAVCKANYYTQLKTIDVVPLPARYDHHLTYHSISSNLSTNLKPSLSIWSSLFEQSSGCPQRKVATIQCSSFECGIRPVSSKLRRRIIGGHSSAFGAWPWQVALYREGDFQCGAVIIDSQWLLSAAHCFYNSSPKAYWTARAGVLRRGSHLRSYHEEIRRVEKIILHPRYIDKGFINDIALLKLDRPLRFSKYIRTICLPSGSVEEDVNSFQNQLAATTIGWGKLYEHGRVFPDTLQEVQLPIISSEECRKRTLFLPLYKITEDMFCAGYERGGRDACLGDSGGPIMVQKNDGKWLLLGITSNGDGCGRANRPGVYTRVSSPAILGWIHNTTATYWSTPSTPEAETFECEGHRCPLGKCLKKTQICDQVLDCPEDASDELSCDYQQMKAISNTTSGSSSTTKVHTSLPSVE